MHYNILKKLITNKIIILILSLLIFSCEKDCDKNCTGIDKNAIEFKWSPFQSDIELLRFIDTDSDDEIILTKSFFSMTTSRFIESECGGFADTLWGNPNVKSCNEAFSSIYNYEFNSLNFEFEFFLNYTPQSIDNKSYDISFNSKLGGAKYRIFDDKFEKVSGIDYSTELENNVVHIMNNSIDRDSNSIKTIWIEKSRGLVKFELDNRIWEIEGI